MLIKICGITAPMGAVECFEAGADMIGLVYYPASPRHVDASQISKILDAVEAYRQIDRKIVLVTVDDFPDSIDSRIDFIQCYGKHFDGFSEKMIPVVKDRRTVERFLTEAETGPKPSFYVLEMSRGKLPGGNGLPWNWFEAQAFCHRFPTLLAGGIGPENVLEVLETADPAGIDVSSGVESSPGVKDRGKIAALIDQVRKYSISMMKGGNR